MIETKDINQIRNALLDPSSMIYVFATEELKKIITNGMDPVISSLPKEASAILLEGKALAVENKMIMDWLDGKIDIKNKRILDLCNIRVFRDTISIR